MDDDFPTDLAQYRRAKEEAADPLSVSNMSKHHDSLYPLALEAKIEEARTQFQAEEQSNLAEYRKALDDAQSTASDFAYEVLMPLEEALIGAYRYSVENSSEAEDALMSGFMGLMSSPKAYADWSALLRQIGDAARPPQAVRDSVQMLIPDYIDNPEVYGNPSLMYVILTDVDCFEQYSHLNNAAVEARLAAEDEEEIERKKQEGYEKLFGSKE